MTKDEEMTHQVMFHLLGVGKPGVRWWEDRSNQPDLAVYRAAAESGDADYQARLGWWYMHGGKGLERDFEQGLYWVRKAAEQGDVSGQYQLASAYFLGHGVRQDAEQGALWLRRAAAQDYPSAQCLLGAAYAHGSGLARDDRQALYWYTRAAEMGDLLALSQLSDVYATGRGTEADPVEAHKWLILAAQRGNGPELNQRLEQSAQRLSHQQVTEAEARAKAWAEQGTRKL